MVHNESQIAFKIFQGIIYLVGQIISKPFRHIIINLRKTYGTPYLSYEHEIILGTFLLCAVV